MSDLPARRTRAYVDLDALAANLAALHAQSGGAGVVLPVKADAYGHGQAPVARRAVSEGVAMLAVANAQELAALRAAGIGHPTLILEDLFEDELPAAVSDPEARFNVSSNAYARLLSAAAEAAGATARVHVNIDTGMGRMGLLSDTPVEDVRTIAGLPGIEVEGVYSHFPDSDEEDLGAARLQLERFGEIVGAIERAGVPVRFRHVANSAAVMVFGPEAAFDLVRPGVSAYGMYPSTEVAERMRGVVDLRPCMTVVSALAKVTTYDREWTVGYGRSYPVGPGSRIGVVPVGYGDGYRRALSNCGTALVHGIRVPVCGRVSMDMITLDLTDLPEEPSVGDEVVLLGRQEWPHGGGTGVEPESREAAILAEEMAEAIDTISYEITCGFTPRIPRIYRGPGESDAQPL
ncbi:MAG: alanine racemase [Bacteroidetes bacterium]|jgi:alanine racemase|nr:alanine racemase [Bacteroidota bacterium]